MPIDAAAAILIVENEPLIAMDVEEMLRSAGYASIDVATSTVEAIDWLDGRSKRGLVILDAFVRDGPTTSLARRLRDFDIPFIVYSGLSQQEVDADPVFDGAAWLTKPCSRDDLLTVVARVSRLAP